jgi:hypothetical protein
LTDTTELAADAKFPEAGTYGQAAIELKASATAIDDLVDTIRAGVLATPIARFVAQIQQRLAPPSTSVQFWTARSVQFASAAYRRA